VAEHDRPVTGVEYGQVAGQRPVKSSSVDVVGMAASIGCGDWYV